MAQNAGILILRTDLVLRIKKSQAGMQPRQAVRSRMMFPIAGQSRVDAAVQRVAPLVSQPGRIHLLGWLTLAAACAAATAEAETDYVREVRPILSANCFSCHGPDESTREAGLRLDVAENAYADLGGYAAIACGSPTDSELVRRVESSDPDLQMPPPSTGRTLSESEKLVLRQWILEGAEYQRHWAFEPVKRPAIPDGESTSGAIDRFVRAKLAGAGLSPAPRADPYALARRVSLDLVGLPPTPQQADAFAANPTDEAYERMVDGLLASPRYGERWARLWLDLARYADTKGYEKDRPRTIWPYRDWVISAINSDMPFDQFTIEQLAGDMLPEPTIDQLIATGFHRNTMTNEEGGIDPQEFRYLSVVDRVNTTGTAWLGLTIGCAQCHTHKYDPITHTDYYALFAVFNNCDDVEAPIPSPQSESKRQETAKQIADLIASLPALYEARAQADPSVLSLREAVSAWITERRQREPRWTPVRPERVETNLPTHAVLKDSSVRISGDVTNSDRYSVVLDPRGRLISAIRIETLPDPSLPGGGAGRRTILDDGGGGLGSFLLTEVCAEIAMDGGTNRAVPLKSATATHSPPGIEADMAIDGRTDTGWTVHGRQRERHTLVVCFDKPVRLADGERLVLTLRHDSFYPAGIGRFRVSVTDAALPVEASDLTDSLVDQLLSSDLPPTELRMKAPEHRPLVEAFLLQTPVLAPEQETVHRLRNNPPAGINALVLRERTDHPRVTHRHHRGEYTQPKEVVAPATPSPLPGLPEGVSANRLSFARWLVSRDNPLTARVAVNRDWQVFFGRGLVGSSADFGLQGDFPTHPELLDWLACELMDGGWSRKRLHKLIVMSETYRQGSVNDQSVDQDPDNLLLARTPRLRLDAEIVRDTLLESSGLIAHKIGGPSVFPTQPAGVTEAAYGPLTWIVSSDQDRYRRGLYTFAKRTAPYAAFGLFDAPSGEVCVAKRDRSNTPLQALAMLNDRVVVEAARSLTLRVVRVNDSARARSEALLRSCVTRPASQWEIEAVVGFVEGQLARLRKGELDPYALLAAGPSREWRFESEVGGWRARNDASLELGDGALVVRATGSDPYIGLELDAPRGEHVVELEANPARDGALELYWTTIDNPTESPERRLVFPATAGQKQLHSGRFRTDSPLRSVRIDVGDGPGVTTIERIRIAYGDGLVSLSADDDPTELAAWHLAARALLNLDEVTTRP